MGSNNENIVIAIKHYQGRLDRYVDSKSNDKILYVLNKLKKIPIRTIHLEETGVGRTVNALKRFGGAVGEAAKEMVANWKMMVLQEEQVVEEAVQEEEEAVDSAVESAPDSYSSDSENYSIELQQSNKLDDVDIHPKDFNDYSSHQIINQDDIRYPDNNLGNHGESSSKHKESSDKNKNDKKREHDSEDEKKSTKKRRKSTETESSDKDSTKYRKDESKKKRDYSEENRKSKHEKSHSKRKRDSSESESEDDRKHKSHHKREDTSDSESDRKKHKSKSSKEDKESSKSKSKEKTGSSSKHSKEKSDKSKKYDEVKTTSEHKHDKRDSSKNKHESKSSSKHEKESHKSKSHSSEKKDKDKGKEKDKDKGKDKDKDKGKDKDKDKGKDKDKHKKVEVKKSEDKSKSREHESPKKEKSGSSSKKSEKDKSSSSSSSSKHKSSSNSENSDTKSKSSKDKIKSSKSAHKIVHGVDSESGTSFAEALGMCGPLPVVNKASSSKKKSATLADKSDSSQSHRKRSDSPIDEDDVEKYVPEALKEAQLEPLNLNIDNLLPEISPNYKPLGLPLDSQPKRIMTDDEALSKVMSTRNQKTKVYSGNKARGKVESLFDLCVRILQDNIDALEYTGGVPYSILKPILERATPDQLFNMEHHNPYLIEDTDELWQLHCQKEFRTKKREELESWREMYMRCLDEREARLTAITANIKQLQDKSIPVRTTKLAYVDSVAKPPRNIARKQMKNGITNEIIEIKPSTATKLTALATSGDAGKISVPNPGSRAVERSNHHGGGSSSAMKPKKAPLMAKTLSFLKNRFRR